MTEETQIVEYNDNKRPAKISMFDMEPEAQIAFASKIATSLKAVIDKQNLFHTIQGKRYVKVEGWELLGTFLGILPREHSVAEHEDGSFTARVELVRANDGTVIGGASALCGVDEKRWSGADRYARRSMAVTRAIGKAYRSSFSWIISLAGYSPTPFEEMPYEERVETRPRETSKRVDTLYSGTTDQQQHLEKYLEDKGISKDSWLAIHEKMIGQPKTDITKILGEIQ